MSDKYNKNMLKHVFIIIMRKKKQQQEQQKYVFKEK